MSRYVFSFWIVSVASGAAILLACGASEPRTLQSITVNPTSANAQRYPGGKVTFVATGYYNSTPKTVTPTQANWVALSEKEANGILNLGSIANSVSIDQAGIAQCAAGASGTYAIVAWDLQDPTLKVSCSSETDFGEPGCNAAQGTAQLTCP